MRQSGLFNEWFTRYGRELQQFVSRRYRKAPEDAEEIVQDVFHNILGIDDIKSIENPKAYLYRSARNLALNRIRKAQHHERYLDEMDADAAFELSPEREVAADKQLQAIDKVLKKVPEKYRRTFLLSRVDAKSYKQISEELKIAESTVEKHVIKVLKVLREHLVEENH